MKVLSINDNDNDNDQVNPAEIISARGLRFSNFSPVGFVREGSHGEPGTMEPTHKISSSSLGHIMSDKSYDKISKIKAC